MVGGSDIGRLPLGEGGVSRGGSAGSLMWVRIRVTRAARERPFSYGLLPLSFGDGCRLRVGTGPPGNAGFTGCQEFLQHVYKGKG
jgi:hypothetical protein